MDKDVSFQTDGANPFGSPKQCDQLHTTITTFCGTVLEVIRVDKTWDVVHRPYGGGFRWLHGATTVSEVKIEFNYESFPVTVKQVPSSRFY